MNMEGEEVNANMGEFGQLLKLGEHGYVAAGGWALEEVEAT